MSRGDAEDLSAYQNGSYDVATASFVLHGHRPKSRLRILREMSRVSRRAVVIQDYGGPLALPMRVLEMLERSDYRNFLRSFASEFDSVFTATRKITVNQESCLYIGYR